MSKEQTADSSPRIDRETLQAIEAEGLKATHDLAHTIVRETIADNGEVDIARLDRAGPTIRKAVLRMLARIAASELAKRRAVGKQKAVKTATTRQQHSALPAAKRKGSNGSSSNVRQAERRARMEWRDLRCDTRSFRASAYRHGASVAAIVGLVSVALLHIFKL